MNHMKHVGTLKNTGDRVFVIYRELPDDPDSALVVYPDRLQDRYQDRVIDLIESDRAQQSENFYEVLNSRAFHDGNNMLNFLHHRGYLKKVLVDNVVLRPGPGEKLALRDYNDALRDNNPNAAARLKDYDEKPTVNETARRVTAADIMGAQQQTTTQSEGPATPQEQAQSMLAQAHLMEQERNLMTDEIERIRAKAYNLDPSLNASDSDDSE